MLTGDLCNWLRNLSKFTHLRIQCHANTSPRFIFMITLINATALSVEIMHVCI